MKELTKKILEAGLVDKATAAMLERWGQLEEGATDVVGRQAVTKRTLEDFIEDIELLLQPEAIEKHETQLEPLLAEAMKKEE